MERRLRDELNVPLWKVERWWIRVPSVLMLGVIFTPIAIIFGIIGGLDELFRGCLIPSIKGIKPEMDK